MSYKRSGKLKLLFWLAFVAVFIYITILSIIIQTFILPDTPAIELPTEKITYILILYGIMALTALAGTVISIFISNQRYMKIFGILIFVIIASVIAGKSILG